MSIESVSDARIFKFANGEIKLEDGRLVFEINSKSFDGGPILATGDPSSTVLVIMEVVSGSTKLFILGEKADYTSLVADGEEADFSDLEMGGSAPGEEAFEGVILQPRLQTSQTSQKYLSNFKCKTPRGSKSRRQHDEDKTYNCNRMQFNYYYEE